jgi:hypothetical protein
MLSLWTAFKSSKLMGYLIVAFAAIGAVVIVLARAFGAGRAAEKAAQAERVSDMRREADEVERMVDRAGDGELDELRRKWTRQ